jgi:hypothetical protein
MGKEWQRMGRCRKRRKGIKRVGEENSTYVKLLNKWFGHFMKVT